MSRVVIEDVELLALHHAIMHGKFFENPRLPEAQGSPHLAAVADRVLDALAAKDERWNEWRQASPTRHAELLESVRQHLKKTRRLPAWQTWSHEKRRKVVRLLLSPLIADDELVDLLIPATDA